MVRPLHPRLIEYALADVEDLFELKEALLQEAGSRNLMGQVLAAQEKAALPKGPERPGYEKLDGYRYLTQEQKTYLRWFFESRDMLARNLNVPAVRVLEKSKLIELAKLCRAQNRLCVRSCASSRPYRRGCIGGIVHRRPRRSGQGGLPWMIGKPGTDDMAR